MAGESNRQKVLEARVFKALSHPVRLKVVELLASGGKCVCEILPALGISQPNASQHLSILRAAGVVDSYRDGTRVMYSLTSPAYAELVSRLESVMMSIAGNASGSDTRER